MIVSTIPEFRSVPQMVIASESSPLISNDTLYIPLSISKPLWIESRIFSESMENDLHSWLDPKEQEENVHKRIIIIFLIIDNLKNLLIQSLKYTFYQNPNYLLLSTLHYGVLQELHSTRNL